MSNSVRIANKDASGYVSMWKEFQGSNMFAKWLDKGNGRQNSNSLYAIFSYGSHFPMYVWDNNEKKWIGNSDKYSQSTTRQQQHTRPSKVDMWLDTESLKSIIWHGGLVEYTIDKARH